MLKTVTFRLTVLFMLLFGILSLALFFLVQNRLSANLMKRIDNELLVNSNDMVDYMTEHWDHRDFLDELKRKIMRETQHKKGERSTMFLV